MPVPNSTFDSVVPLPPRVVSIHNALFEAPDETGLSVSVPTSYQLFTGSVAPNNLDGNNGDWYIWVSASTIKTYRKVINVWTLVSTITGGGGGGGGDLSGITLTDCLFTLGAITDSTIASSVITTATIVAPTITAPVISGGVVSGVTITASTVTGLPTPVAPSDAVTKSYVDGVAQGLAVHEAVRVGTAGSNITLAGGAPDTLDGVALALNDRIMVKDQTNQIQNGIYAVTTLGTGSNGTWTRAADADSGHELDAAYVLVQVGTANGGSSWVVSGAPLIGTDNIIWTRFFAVTSIPASAITGTIDASQIDSINANQINGLINASQINSINAGQIAGTISASQIGSVNATAIVGAINSSQIGSVNATAISGVITAGQIGSINASAITGVIVTNQLADQILNTQRLIANDLSVVRRVTSLPGLPSTDFPPGSLALNTTNKTLYQNVSNVWQVVTASSNVVGTLTANDIASVNANSIVGLIIASQISSVNATSLIGSISAGQITSVNATAIQGTINPANIGNINASSIVGSITASQIGSVNASAITGTISASQISSVNASSISGTISASQISQVNANTITVGALNSINYTMPGSNSGNSTSITPGGLQVGQITLNGTSTQNDINIWSAGSFPVFITGGAGGAALRLGQNSASGSVIIGAGNTNQITVRDYGTVGRNGSGRFEVAALSGNSLVFTTNGGERWLIGGDTHLKTFGGYIQKVSSDGWTPRLYDGSHTIEFQWSGGLYARIDGGTTVGPLN